MRGMSWLLALKRKRACATSIELSMTDKNFQAWSCPPIWMSPAIFAVHGKVPHSSTVPISENIHGIDERVSLPSVRRVTKALALFAAEWCGVV